MQAQTGPGEGPCGARLNPHCQITSEETRGLTGPGKGWTSEGGGRVTWDMGRWPLPLFPSAHLHTQAPAACPHLHSCSELLRLRCCLTVLVTRTPGVGQVRAAEVKTPPNKRLARPWGRTSSEEPLGWPPSPGRTDMGAALTPAVRHDLQGQGHQVIEGGVQDDSTDVWVGHGCPRGWENGRGRGTLRGADRRLSLGSLLPTQPFPGSLHPHRLCPHLLGRDRTP